eukprot:TRINITY_DN16398_c0_g1_i1.p1 TRINITY_DN16398_c0_g1~~TRINITY_DN16398_c0_g1_i1.p1  ORF type:complete len:156 (-),score=55.44 TRINITY_DN16398_c0_g1_i1:432-875(-)
MGSHRQAGKLLTLLSSDFMVRSMVNTVRGVLVGLILVLGVTGQFDEEEKDYRGQFIGSLNSYHHQVSGDVYAVDADTLLLQNFVYDGNGKDTFFWAGSSNRPGSKGFIVPDKSGRTNVLDRYLNEEFTIKLPSQKRITDLKWFPSMT